MVLSAFQPRRIRILREEVSRKIAAGEVIDRPFSIVRELMDNAIDSGARSVEVYLEGGGLSRIRVVDDGTGMGEEDLGLCWQPHATSKIETEDDLLRISSLGFRGEALSSIALCSRLVIISCDNSEGPAHQLEVRGGVKAALEKTQGRKGTVVDVSELFFNYPARKKFLRSASAESALCRSTFVDRAVAYPSISFRLFSEGVMKLSLPPAPPIERIAGSFDHQLDARLLWESSEDGKGFSVQIIAGSPDLRRRDRRLLQCFVNRRRVTEFALLQAVEFGFAGHMPGGWHPAAFIFVEMDPSLVDCNIHPTKKEVRLRNLPEVHRSVVVAVRKMLEPRAPVPQGTPPRSFQVDRESRGERSLPVFSPSFSPNPPGSVPEAASGIRYLGQVFGIFLVFELPGRLLMLDQHAAHERIIYERLAARPPALQEMLFPLCFDVTDEEEKRLMGAREELEEIGIGLKRAGPHAIEISALAADLKPLPEADLLDMVRTAGAEQWRRSLLATAACRLALKEGDPVDPVSARELCAQVMKLPVPRCPHGRPIWHELSKNTLMRLVERPIPDTLLKP
jgi:DNA mismatch repair protein MutL